MKRSFHWIVVIIVIAFFFTSCKKYLDAKTYTNLKTPTTLEDLQGLMDDAYNMNQLLTPCLGEISADDYFIFPNNYNILKTHEQDIYNWRPTAYQFPNDWARAYTAIFNANYCIEDLEKFPITQKNADAWNNINGAAHFHRAYNFLNMLWTHAQAYDKQASKADLGIVLRLGSDFNVVSVRSDAAKCYEQVIEDAKTAVHYLPLTPTHVYRPSKWSAYGLLARTYLSMREYDSAGKYADMALRVKNTLMDFNNLPVTTNNPFPVFNEEIMFYTEMNLSFSNLGRGEIDTVFYSSYLPGDLRSLAYFRPQGQYQRIKKNYAANGLFTGIATDEMLLIRAECQAREGKIEQALDDLNYLLKKRFDSRFIALTSTDQQEVLNMVLSERRKELPFRGLRWVDIKRFNRGGANIVQKRLVNGNVITLPAGHKFYALPLPSDIISISGIEQNP